MRDIHPARPTPPRQHRAGNAIAREVGAAALAGVGVIALAQAGFGGVLDDDFGENRPFALYGSRLH